MLLASCGRLHRCWSSTVTLTTADASGPTWQPHEFAVRPSVACSGLDCHGHRRQDIQSGEYLGWLCLVSGRVVASVSGERTCGAVDLTDQESEILTQLEQMIRLGNVGVEEAARRLRVMGIDASIVGRVKSLRESIAREKQHIAIDASMFDPEDAPAPWYIGPARDDVYWPALKSVLASDVRWAEALPSLDAASTDVVAMLADPHSPKIGTRGLVLGHVQSGKTANFTATIAKAADAGYRLFIVLSGVHNALRRQTQLRLEEQLSDLNKKHWLELTTEGSDFGNPVKALALVAGTDLRILAVVKKNVSRLTRLRDWLMLAHEEGGLDNCPVLIIDDEADQASPNSAKNADLDRTKINQRIVELLTLPRVAYIAYTATPFANVLINPDDRMDLYPRSFIYSLPKPSSYFGSEALFGLDELEDEHDPDSAPHDMIRTVPEEEAGLHQPKRGEPLQPTVTPSLGEAIRWFLMATAARRSRDGVTRHSSMLIHTTMNVDPQLLYLPVIRIYLKDLRREWSEGEKGRWREMWELEQEREPSSRHGLVPVTFDEMSVELSGVLDARDGVTVVADNSRSIDRLIYTREPVTVIAVGGNTLSRGLTLEGLVSSFFLRSAGTFDSLMQMGRWFGYRPGYGDLPRIWTTDKLADDYRFLSEVERDIRADIDRYSSEQATPLELPVRIRVHSRMQVTARNKMQFAVPAEASYSGHRPQTTYFRYKDIGDIAANRAAGASLLRRAIEDGSEVEAASSRIILKGVDVSAVLEFVRAFRFHKDTDLRSDLLEGYIRRQYDHGALDRWNVAVITRRPPADDMDLGLATPVRLLTRSKLRRSSSDTTANIGTLMSKPDRVADLMDASDVAGLTDAQLLDMRSKSGRALLLLYPIDKNSVPKPSASGHREKLGAHDHLLGVAFAFPRAVPGSEATELIHVDPALLHAADTPAEVDEYVDEEGDSDDVDLSDG